MRDVHSEAETMTFRRLIQFLPHRIRRIVGSRYRPERHYMRGFGPACAARRGDV